MSWRYIKRTFAIIFALLAVGVIGSFALARLDGNKVLSVQSGSMVPALHKGDLISVNSVPYTEIRVGDVITYIKSANSKTTITHRVIKVDGHKFTTKGDANNAEDPVVYANQLVGIQKSRLPYLGYFIDFMRTWPGLILTVYLPALLIIISELRRLAKYFKSQEPYVLPGRKSRLIEYNSITVSVLKVLPLLIFVPLFFVVRAYAVLNATATLTDTTISTAPITPPVNVCTGTGNSTSATVNINGSGGSSSSNNVNVSNSSSQTATTGNANNNNNGSGGSATSGNATNCNNTNININITNH